MRCCARSASVVGVPCVRRYAGLATLRTAFEDAEQAITSKSATVKTYPDKLNELWFAVEGRIKKNDPLSYVNFEDALARMVNAAKSSTAADAQKALGNTGAEGRRRRQGPWPGPGTVDPVDGPDQCADHSPFDYPKRYIRRPGEHAETHMSHGHGHRHQQRRPDAAAKGPEQAESDADRETNKAEDEPAKHVERG